MGMDFYVSNKTEKHSPEACLRHLWSFINSEDVLHVSEGLLDLERLLDSQVSIWSVNPEFS